MTIADAPLNSVHRKPAELRAETTGVMSVTFVIGRRLHQAAREDCNSRMSGWVRSSA
ncbi:hypothetical protein [Azospirillum doebereinerae]|uniref:hypothetical protein n=1 Tax=Azospirillum doebereinerae TaxID=92933 RepID=UPI00163CC1BA|nr:hypothetical protein [Azospirillum doebereinerae]